MTEAVVGHVRNHIKQLALNRIRKELYDPQDRYLNDQMAMILRQNNAIYRSNADFFFYKNNRYPQVYGGTGVKLHPSFSPKVDAILLSYETTVKDEQPFILNSIHTFLNRSFSYHDAIRYFPTGMRQIVEKAWDNDVKHHPAVMTDKAIADLQKRNERGLLQMELLLAANVLV